MRQRAALGRQTLSSWARHRWTSAPREFAERELWNIDSGSTSVRLDVEGPDDVAPLLRFVGDQLSELSRRSRQRHAAEVSETGLHLRIVESRVDLFVELLDDLGRRGLRCADALPPAR